MVDLCSVADLIFRREIVEEARSWLGTPYVHQSSCRGAGCDCLGLIRGIWRHVYGDEPEPTPAYSQDWAETGGSERLLGAARRHMTEIAVGDASAGDMLLFRMRSGAIAKHIGVLVEGKARGGRMIHAYSGHSVLETPISPAWQKRICAAFKFPLRAR